MPEPGWTSWVINDQATMDTCGNDLQVAGFSSTVHRPVGDGGALPPVMQINVPTDQLNPKIVTPGQVVVLMADLLLIFTADQYANSPFNEGD